MRLITIMLLLVSFNQQPFAQSATNDVNLADSLFWNAYNHCDITTMKSYFANDIEFYHDKGGITLGADELTTSFVKGPCRNADSFSLRREAVPQTIKTYPLYKNNTLYGAIITGDHMFYITEKNKKEFADGHAQFANLWLIENGTWKMKRVLSYDHRPATPVPATSVPASPNKEKAIVPVSAAILKEYAGKYQGGKNGPVTVQSAKGYLVIISDNSRLNAYPSSSTLFFVKERNLSFQFSKKGAGIIDMTVRENGEVVDSYHAAKR